MPTGVCKLVGDTLFFVIVSKIIIFSTVREY